MLTGKLTPVRLPLQVYPELVEGLRSRSGNSVHLCLATSMKRKILFFFGLLCLLLAIADMVTWIIVSAPSEKSFEAVVAEYTSLFPKPIADPVKLTFLNILLLLAAGICFIFSYQKTNIVFYKKFCLVLIVFSGFLAFWNLFSLM